MKLYVVVALCLFVALGKCGMVTIKWLRLKPDPARPKIWPGQEDVKNAGDGNR